MNILEYFHVNESPYLFAFLSIVFVLMLAPIYNKLLIVVDKSIYKS